jgi:hypothetical protein
MTAIQADQLRERLVQLHKSGQFRACSCALLFLFERRVMFLQFQTPAEGIDIADAVLYAEQHVSTKPSEQ